MSIPRSVKYEIAKHLERNDINNLKLTCKSWHKCLNENYFWEVYLKKIYPHDKLTNFLEDYSNYKRLALHLHHSLIKFQRLEIEPPFTANQYFPTLGVCDIATGDCQLQAYIQEIWRDGNFEKQIVVSRNNDIINMTTLENAPLKIKIHKRTICVVDIKYNLYALDYSIHGNVSESTKFTRIANNVKDFIFQSGKCAYISTDNNLYSEKKISESRPEVN